jgi:hypothetical protein
MNKTVQNILIGLVVIFGAAGLLWSGIIFGRSTALSNQLLPWGKMGEASGIKSYQPGGSWMHLRRGISGRRAVPAHPGSFPRHPGMIPGRQWSTFRGHTSELTLEQTREAALAYVDKTGLKGLVIQEIMLFSRNGYVIIAEEDTGTGAFELLIDPATQTAFLEYGPTRMWNLKYSRRGAVPSGCRMAGFSQPEDVTAGKLNSQFTMPFSAEDASEIAQDYLTHSQTDHQGTAEITAFYGYYTIDIEDEDGIIGMLSVNGFTGEVFPHSWHGDFIKMFDYHH